MDINNIKNNKNKWLIKISVVLFALLIILFSEASLEGATRGLLLWFNTVLPTLLPFMIISNLLVNMDIAHVLGELLYPIFKILFRVSPGGCYPILIGLLSGIPVGAKTIADLVEKNDIDLDEGQYLLSFCNNASPMFIMNFIAITQLEQSSLRFHLLFINFISGYLGGILYFKLGGKFKKSINKTLNSSNKHNRHLDRETPYSVHTQELTKETNSKEATVSFDFSMLDTAIMDSFEVITKVGGYIILFSIPTEIISSSGVNPLIKLITNGMLEIATGISYISNSSLSLNTKIVLIVSITAFGGFSALAQTNSVINKTRLSIGIYFKNKLIQMILATLLASLLLV